MEFNFEDLLKQGHEAAEIVIKNKSEIEETFRLLERSISNFIEIEVSIIEEEEYDFDEKPRNKLMNAFIIPSQVATGYNLVSIKHPETNVSKYLFSIKRSSDGYPITVVFGKANFIAETQDELRNTIGLVISKPDINLALRSFKREVLIRNEKNNSNTAE